MKVLELSASSLAIKSMKKQVSDFLQSTTVLFLGQLAATDNDYPRENCTIYRNGHDGFSRSNWEGLTTNE
jgi:hypothetical protein